MAQIKPEYFAFDEKKQLVRVRMSDFQPQYQAYDVALENFYPWDLIARYTDRTTFGALLCTNKSLHKFLASKKQEFAHFFKELPEITVTNNSIFFISAFGKLTDNQYLLLSGIRYKQEIRLDTSSQIHESFACMYYGRQSDLPVVRHPNSYHFNPLSLLLTRAPYIERFPLKITDEFMDPSFPEEYKQLVWRSLPKVTNLLLSHHEQGINRFKIEFLCNEDMTYEEKIAHMKENYLELLDENPNAQRGKNALLSILQRSSQLETLLIHGDDFFSHDLAGLAPNTLPKLKALGIGSDLMTAQTLKTILKAAPHIEELDLSMSRIYVDDLFLNLEPGSLENLKKVTLPTDSHENPNFRICDASLLGGMTQTHVEALKNAAPLLEELRTAPDFMTETYKVFFPSPPNGEDSLLLNTGRRSLLGNGE